MLLLALSASLAQAGPAVTDEQIADRAALRSVVEALDARYGSPTPSTLVPDPPGRGSRYLDVYTSGDLAFAVDTKGEWLVNATEHIFSGDLNWVLNSISAAFYDECGDDYQYLNVMIVNDIGFFAAFYSPLANDVYGIGYDSMIATEVFDQSRDSQLEGFIFMNAAELWADNPETGRYVFGQEFMHRWGAFVNIEHEGLDANALLGRDTAHWSYWLDTTNSPMEGNRWLDNGDGTWSVDYAATSTYSDLDLYLMGFLPPEAVGPQTLLLVDDEEQSRVRRDPAYTPEYLSEVYGNAGQSITVTAEPVTFTVDDIVAAEGERIPAAADSPRTFRMATVVLVLASDTLDDSTIAMIDGVRTAFESDWEDDVQGLADLDTSLGKCTAPEWGDDGDSGDSSDSGTAGDSGTTGDSGDGGGVDTGGGESAYRGGCGCSTGAPGAGWLVVGLAGLALARRRSSPSERSAR